MLGFPDVAKNCMLQSFHQSGEQFEILFNKAKYDALPAELKAIIDYAVQAASADMSWKAIERNSQDYIELKKAGDQVLQDARRDPARAARRRGTRSSAKKAGENPLFKKVLDSQKAFAQRAGQWQNDYMVDFKMAYNHYFRAAGQEGLIAVATEQGPPASPVRPCRFDRGRTTMQSLLLAVDRFVHLDRQGLRLADRAC